MRNFDFTQHRSEEMESCAMVRCEPTPGVLVSHIAVLRSEQQDPDALHVGAAVQQVDGLVQVILISQRDGQLQ